MNVLFEDDGSFKVGMLLADQGASLQVEAPHGKRSKIKNSAVLLRFTEPSVGELMARAEVAAAELDVDFLWQCCATEEFEFSSLAAEYYGHAPSAIDATAVLIRLHRAPMYFYKRGKGRYKAAPPEALKAALASALLKRKQEQLKVHYVNELSAGSLPPAFAPLVSELLYNPDKNSLEYKALDIAAGALQLGPPEVLARCGAIASAYDYHLNRFLFEYFPNGSGFMEVGSTENFANLPIADVQAFSIDDATTTEIDNVILGHLVDRRRHSNRCAYCRAGARLWSPFETRPDRTQPLIDRVPARREDHHAAPSGDRALHLERGSRVSGGVALSYCHGALGYAIRAISTRIERVPIVKNLREMEWRRFFTIGTRSMRVEIARIA